MNRHEKRRKLVILIFLIKYFKIFFNLLSCLLAFKCFNAFFFSSKGMPVIFIKDGLCLTMKDLGSGWLGDLYQYRRGREGWGTNSTEQKFISCINTLHICTSILSIQYGIQPSIDMYQSYIWQSFNQYHEHLCLSFKGEDHEKNIWRFKHTRYCSTGLNKQVSHQEVYHYKI